MDRRDRKNVNFLKNKICDLFDALNEISSEEALELSTFIADELATMNNKTVVLNNED